MSSNIGMIDIAVDLTDQMFRGIYNGRHRHAADKLAVLARAWSAGVDRITVTGGSIQESKEALAVAETDGRLFCTVGVYPTSCKEFEESGDSQGHFQALVSLAREGVEKGKQIELAEAIKLPMFLHMCAAAEDFCNILARNRDSVNGCSLKTTENLEVLRGIPTESMMLETDSPYCEIRSIHAGMRLVKSIWPSKKKEKYDMIRLLKVAMSPVARQVLEVVVGCKGGDIDQLSKSLYHHTCRTCEVIKWTIQKHT